MKATVPLDLLFMPVVPLFDAALKWAPFKIGNLSPVAKMLIISMARQKQNKIFFIPKRTLDHKTEKITFVERIWEMLAQKL